MGELPLEVILALPSCFNLLFTCQEVDKRLPDPFPLPEHSVQQHEGKQPHAEALETGTKQALPSLNCHCRVFGRCDKKNNQYKSQP